MAGEYDVGPWVERVPGAWWRATNRARHAVADVLAANDGNGYDVLVGDGAAPPRRWGWRHDPRKARNAALAALRARGLTTPPDEPEPSPVPAPSRTLFECRTCGGQTCGGWSDGTMDRPGWHDIEHIDGPRSMCPVCRIIGESMLDGLREEYPNVSIGRERPHRPTPATPTPATEPVPPACATCPHAVARFNNGHGATTCGLLNHVIVAYGHDRPTTAPAGCPLVTPATEAPTAPSEPDEGAASPAGPGEAVRPRVGAWVETGFGWARFWRADWFAAQAQAHSAPLRYFAWHPEGLQSFSMGDAPTLDAAKAAADAALEAAGYVLEGGAHVDPGAVRPAEVALHQTTDAMVWATEMDRIVRERGGWQRMDVAWLHTWFANAIMCGMDEGARCGVRKADGEAAYLRAEVARLTADRDEAREARDAAAREWSGALALLERIAEALGIPGDWRDYADGVLVTTAADWRAQAKRHEDAATVACGEAAVLREALARLTEQAEAVGDVARVLRCEPGDVAGAAQAALEQAALARGEAAGLERALRVLAEVRRG